MAMANHRRRSPSPPSTASMSRSTIAADPPPYFLPELIPEVARRLTSLQDFFALRAACRALLPLTPSNLASQAPLLLVLSDDATPCPSLIHPLLRRTHRFRLPRTSRAGAGPFAEFHPLGCRVAISKRYYSSLPNHEFSIIHLLTGERVCLPSPPGHFSHVISSGDLLVAWSYRDIFYYHFGAPKWRVASRYRNEFRDLILVKDTLYGLTRGRDQRVTIVELPDNNNGLKLAFLERGFDIQEHETWAYSLAECRGELLLVICQRSKGFYVLQWQSGERKWVRITSLGGCTLFFAGPHFSGYLGPDHPGIRGHCIYKTNLGCPLVFSLIDQSLDQVATCSLQQIPFCSAPSWVFPSMC